MLKKAGREDAIANGCVCSNGTGARGANIDTPPPRPASPAIAAVPAVSAPPVTAFAATAANRLHAVLLRAGRASRTLSVPDPITLGDDGGDAADADARELKSMLDDASVRGTGGGVIRLDTLEAELIVSTALLTLSCAAAGTATDARDGIEELRIRLPVVRPPLGRTPLGAPDAPSVGSRNGATNAATVV